jgi:HlyD family secretion protein
MDVKAGLRQQLQTLRIPTEQRPAARDGAPRTRSRARALLLAVLCLALGGAAVGLWQRFGGQIAEQTGVTLPGLQPPATVRLWTVTARSQPPVGPVLTATGKIVSDHQVAVATKVSGQIVELHFEQGDSVRAGQLLARIEDVNYRARRDEAAALVQRAEAHLAYQRFNFRRIESMHQSGTSSDIELAEARRALGEAEAQLAAQQAALAWAQKALRDTEVLAPISGVVLERNVEVGDFVAAEGGRGAIANALFAIIADMSKLRVEVDISELDIARIRAGMPCLITPDAYKDRRYRGHVLWIDPGANYAKATVQAKVRIENPDEYLRVEGSAQVQFLPQDVTARESAAQPVVQSSALPGGSAWPGDGSATSASVDAAVDSDAAATAPVAQSSASVSTPSIGIWIPASAIRLDAPGAGQAPEASSSGGTVFVVQDGRLRKTHVTVGRRSGEQIEITAGLSAGQTIAAEGLDKLFDGQRIKPARP